MILEQLLEPGLMFFDPSKRFFWGSLLASLLLIILVSGSRRGEHLRILFSPRIWFHRSSLADMKIIGINTLFRLLVFPGSFVTTVGIAAAISLLLTKIAGGKPQLGWSPFWVTALYSVVIFLADDFARFFFHYLQHRWRWLWCFHQVHHSALVMTPLTLMRTHPVDILWARIRNSITYGLVTGVFFFLFGSAVSGWDIIGAEALGFLFNLAGSNLRHSQVWIHFGPLEKIFISPAAHQIHHSRDVAHFDKNFGVCLALWDLMWKTHVNPRHVTDPVRFGLDGSPLSDERQSIVTLYVQPFRDLKAKRHAPSNVIGENPG
ncbi:MAG TPA: sterol desaturase family protein [Oligoflexus sp.]|uniref:sterol desaturase family protein n=1 Tax=Oligoflexus sp. TaxID=1971216 RepID=UPI002D650B4B|nr:sterol desaturase family protein [Oligoflexus sp.]HYX34347.1 sterol desaturase family protein [Oligoflexus sp.]